jgi:hypothetical protein
VPGSPPTTNLSARFVSGLMPTNVLLPVVDKNEYQNHLNAIFSCSQAALSAVALARRQRDCEPFSYFFTRRANKSKRGVKTRRKSAG